MILIWAIFLVFLVRTIINTLNIIWLWQLKGYRADRVFVHFRDTKEGRQFLVNPKTIAFAVLLVLIPLSFDAQFSFFYQLGLLGVFLWDLKDIVRNIALRFIRKPVFTMRVFGMVGLTFAFVVSLFLFLPIPPVAIIIIADRLIFPVIALSILITAIPIFFAKRILLYLATQKRVSFKNLIVIGVTGSYGKSSTKDLIANFLSEKYNVVKTERTNNTEIAIARLILNKLTKETEVLVVEIGAYRRGHVAEVCRMVKPTIGVLTGINEQHLSLFGGAQNTKKAKFELIQSLPEKGMAFFNGDDPIAAKLSKNSHVNEIYLYRASDINKLKGPFMGNIAAAVAIAKKLGVDEKKIAAKVAKTAVTASIPSTVTGDLTILDDSRNTNPKGFEVALDMLGSYGGEKILITPGIIELGSESDRIHSELGGKIGTICEYVILVNDNFEEPVREGLVKTKFDMKHLFIPKREELVSVIKSLIKGKTVVLLEGRVPAEIHSMLSS